MLSEKGATEHIVTDAAVGLGGSGGLLYDLNTNDVIEITQAMGNLDLFGLSFTIPIEHLFTWSGTDPTLGVEVAIGRIKLCNGMINLLDPSHI